MRVLAKFQFAAPSVRDEVASGIRDVLDRWAEQKFCRTDDGGLIIRQGGATAQFDFYSSEVGDIRRDTYVNLEPVSGGSLQTDVDIVSDGKRTAFRCVISVGSNSGVAPADVPLRAPRFIREIIALRFPWTVGGTDERVFSTAFSADFGEVSKLQELMFTPERRLPIVIISDLGGETIAGDMHECVSRDLCGLAHTVRLSGKASWELTASLGREWSCYNGAVRLLWPIGTHNRDFRSHPLWTSDFILSRADTKESARDRFRGTIAGRVFEASTFVADDPAVRNFEGSRLRQAAEASAAARIDGDDKALADAYAAENDILRSRLKDRDNEIALLQENVDSLSVALRARQPEVPNEVVEAPPQTVEEAIAAARRELKGRLVIASETDTDVANLNPSAGPPEKIMRYLRALAELSVALGAGSIGKAVPIWLREHGVDCSVDSETIKASKEGRLFRNRVIDGERVECEFHAKPSDGVSPDMCVRIYFAVTDTAPFVRIGYIGRHSL